MKRNVFTIIIIVLLLLSSIIVIPVSNADFYTSVEKTRQISNEIKIRNVDLVTLTDTSMIVTWTTNVNCSTYLDYGFHPFLLENHYSEDNQISVDFHYLELDGLQQGTTYFYRVGSGESRSCMRIFTTLTPPSGEYLFSFATITDKHVYSYNPDSIALNELAVEEINQRDVEFVIDKGDIGYPFNQSKNITDGFNISYYPVYGDNDFIDSDGNVESFMDEYGLDIMYYSFDHGDYHFVILDTVNRLGYETGAITDEQFTWLKEDLKENSDKKIMIFMHHPSSLYDVPLKMALNAVDGLKFRYIISNYNVVGIFSGHTHRNKVTYSLMTKYIPYAETAAVHKYPSGYNIYKVYTNGYMQSFYKVNSELTENRRKNELEDLLSPLCGRFGFVWDRNFVVRYPLDENNYVEMIKDSRLYFNFISTILRK